MKKERRYTKKMVSEYNLIKFIIPHYKEMQKKLAILIKKNFKKRKIKIIDLGSGTGFTTLMILKRLSSPKIILVDNNLLMIKQSKARLKKYKGLSFVYRDGLEYLKKLESNSIDCIASALVLHNFKKSIRKSYIKQIYRVLNHRGLFINADKYASKNKKQHRKDFNFQMSCFDKFKKFGENKLIKDWKDHYILDMKKERIMRVNSSLRELKQAGFKNVNQLYRKYMFAIFIAIKP